ncbi:hypothetical protein BH10PSE19_BH10PSE19_20340 [soil metagenome]
MGIPLMIQPDDERRIIHLKEELGIRTKVDVIRAGITLLEQEAEHLKKINRWKQAVALVTKQSDAINKEFQPHSRLKQQ